MDTRGVNASLCATSLHLCLLVVDLIVPQAPDAELLQVCVTLPSVEFTFRFLPVLIQAVAKDEFYRYTIYKYVLGLAMIMDVVSLSWVASYLRKV